MIADTTRGKRVVETAGAPVYYLPPADILMAHLIPIPKYGTMCEWKGSAAYFAIEVGDKRAEKAAWYYPNPTPAFAEIKDYIAFYAQLMDDCLVNGEKARPQSGGFYGGWITDDIVGPFKGEPGTGFW
jgi:uncharacterized protein (DUF427 family)